MGISSGVSWLIECDMPGCNYTADGYVGVWSLEQYNLDAICEENGFVQVGNNYMCTQHPVTA